MGTLHSALVGDALHIAKTQVGTADPNSVITAGVIGQLHWDSTNNKLYIAEAADNASWIATVGGSDTLAEVLAGGNTSGGTDLVVSTGDVITLVDLPTVDTDGANKSYVDAVAASQDTLSEVLALGNTSGGTDVSISSGDDILLADSSSAIFGDSGEFTISHTAGSALLLNTSGALIFEQNNLTGNIIFRLGADNENSNFEIRNSSETVIFRLNSDGTDSIIENVTGDIAIEPAGDLVVTTDNGGDFLFDSDSLRAGASVTEYLASGHDGTNAFINAVGDGLLNFQHEGSTLATLSDTGKLSLPQDSAGPQLTIGASDDFQFFHTGTVSHMQNFVGDLKITVVTADLVVETTTNGHFLFTESEFRGGFSTSEYLAIGHDDTDAFINAVGDGLMKFEHEGVSVMSLSDASVLDFLLAATISTTAGDLTLNPASELNISSDLNFDGGGNILIKRGGQTVVTIDTNNDFNTGGDLYTFDVIAADLSGNRLDVTQEVVAPEISISETFTFHEGSTQHVAAVPDLRSGRISTLVLNQSTDLSAQENNPQHVYMRVDGLKIFIVGEQGNGVDEYDMTIPWDTSTISHVQFFSVSGQDTAPKGIFFKPDGLRMYIAGGQNDRVYQYDLGTAWNVSTAVYNSEFVSVVTDTPNPASLVFQPDGSTFFTCAFTAGTNAVTHYGMSTKWDVTTASFINGFVPTEPTDISGIGIRNDGALLYIGSSADDTIYEYFLGTPWNTTANTNFLASYDVSDDGFTASRGVFFSPFYDKMYYADPGSDELVEYHLGITVDGNIFADNITVIPSNVFDITQASDLTDNAVGGVWTISADTTLNWMADVSSTVRFSIDDGITLHIDGSNRATAKYTYDGGDSTTVFSGEGAVRMFGMKNWDCDINSQGATLANLTAAGNPGTGGTLNIRDCLNVTEWVLGSTNGQVFGIDSVFVNVGSGFTLNNPTLVNITDWAIEGSSLGGHFIRVNTNNPASIMNFTDISGLSLSSGGALFHFEGNSNNNARFSVKNCKVAKDDDGLAVGNLFEPQTTGFHGFTAVADGSPATGTITTSVSNGSGGTTISCTTTFYEDEEVTISGATASDGTWQIFNVVAGVSFDIIRTFTATDTTGSVDSDRLTLTLVTGHLTAVGDLLDIENSNFYNGFKIALNFPSTDVMNVNGVFISTDTGDYTDGGGLDQSDPRVIGIGNSPFVPSHYIATAYVNDNSTANGSITNNAFTDMVFGTAGDALIAGSTMERWRLVNELNGTFEYIGNEPFDGDITFNFTVVSSGGTVEFRFKWERQSNAAITANTISFLNSNPDAIDDSGDGFLTAGFKAGDTVTVSGSTSNDGTYLVDTVSAGQLTLDSGESLTAESAGDLVTVSGAFGDLVDSVEALIDVASNVRSITKTYPLAMSKGDQIKPQITRNTGTSTITTTYATIYASM